MVREFENTHNRIDRDTVELEKQLDKRFDNVYRKLPKITPEPTGQMVLND